MVESVQRAGKEPPDSVQVHQYLLYGLLKMGNKKAAVAELEQLIRLQPKEKKHLRQAANLYEELGKYPGGGQEARSAAETRPEEQGGPGRLPEAAPPYARWPNPAQGVQKPTQGGQKPAQGGR